MGAYSASLSILVCARYEMLIPFACFMGEVHVVLIAVSATDIASTNQSDALMKMSQWESSQRVEGQPTFKRLHARIWVLPGSVLREDFLARRWMDATGEIDLV